MMGLYDTVVCDYPLPLPDFTEDELNDINHDDVDELNWAEVEWQTKDLENMLDTYTIEEDGQIYTQKSDWVEDPKSPTGFTPQEAGIQKYERTGEVNFYNAILGKKYDHWIEFKATIWKGDLKELELAEYKKEDNAERIKMQGEIQSVMEKAQSKGLFYKIYKFLISKPLEIMRYILGWIVKFTWRLERWLT